MSVIPGWGRDSQSLLLNVPRPWFAEEEMNKHIAPAAAYSPEVSGIQNESKLEVTC